MITNRIPPSLPGQFMCERLVGPDRLHREVVNGEAEAQRRAKAGATIWVGRHGGWVKNV